MAAVSSNIRQLPPTAVLDEYPERLGLRVTMVHIAIYADLAPRLSELGLTSPSRMTALSHIRARPGCSQSELGLFTGLSRASAMTMVDQLERAGLVVRAATTDARINALHLTPRGEAALAKARAQTAINEEKVFGGLSADERGTLKRLLKKVIDHCAEQSGRANASKSKEGEAS